MFELGVEEVIIPFKSILRFIGCSIIFLDLINVESKLLNKLSSLFKIGFFYWFFFKI